MRSGAVAAQGDVSWVAAEERDVLLYPLEGEALVFQAVVHAAVCEHFFTSQKTPWPDSVVEVDDYDVHVGSSDEAGAVVIGITVCVEASTLNEEVDWQL